jgi:cytochrome c oxidase subunit IV
MREEEGSSREFTYGTYVGAWFCLLVLTAITVAVARLSVTDYAVAGPIIIATIKSGLVVVFFMHLRNEPWIVKIMLFLALLALALIILLTFSDVAFRDMRM